LQPMGMDILKQKEEDLKKELSDHDNLRN